MNIFVDVDDTLIKWYDSEMNSEGAHPYGDGESSYKINQDLVDILIHIYENRMSDVYIWSGGGTEYAANWARECGFPDLIWITAIAKDTRVTHEDDICIDDMDIKFSNEPTLMTAEEFVELFYEGE